MSATIDQISEQIFRRQVPIVMSQIDALSTSGFDIECFYLFGGFVIVEDEEGGIYYPNHIDNCRLSVESNNFGEKLRQEHKQCKR